MLLTLRCYIHVKIQARILIPMTSPPGGRLFLLREHRALLVGNAAQRLRYAVLLRESGASALPADRPTAIH
jgi:hypothetical protein